MGTAPLRSCRAVALLFLLSWSPAQPAAADEGTYLLHLERGDSIQVLRLEPATFGMFRYVRTDSVEGYLSGHRVKSITDREDRDATRDVLERRKSLGEDPLAHRGDGPAKVRVYRPSHREVRHFPVFEVGVYSRLDHPPPPYQDTNVMVSVDFGEMRNLSQSIAIGGALHLEGDDERVGLGLAFRGRRWLEKELSVDGAVGWVFAGSDDRGDFHAPAFYGEVAVNLGDHFQLAARIESWKVAQRLYVYDFPLGSTSGSGAPVSRPASYVIDLGSKRETLIHLGGKVGTAPGIPILLLFLLLGSVDSTRIY